MRTEPAEQETLSQALARVKAKTGASALSPLQAVKQSIDVCWQTHKQVGKAIA